MDLVQIKFHWDKDLLVLVLLYTVIQEMFNLVEKSHQVVEIPAANATIAATSVAQLVVAGSKDMCHII